MKNIDLIELYKELPIWLQIIIFIIGFFIVWRFAGLIIDFIFSPLGFIICIAVVLWLIYKKGILGK
ncbi:MAG: hypothetical protein ACTSR2_01610 [Candidatus Hodarchaeales archaeon]